ncbi:MAG: M3 family metallopeptidase [Candidatus Cryptobacteroides sp.]
MFLQEWDTPYGIPPFERIKEKDYIPAVKLGIKLQEAEIDAIIARNDEPTFENTVAAYERSGAVLDKVTGVLFNLSETDATESLQKIVEKVIPMITEHSDNIFMNPYLFERVDILYRKKDCLGLTREQEMVLEDMHRAFVKNGIALDKDSQKRMKEINSALASLEYAFGNNLLAENNAFQKEFGISVSEYVSEMTSCQDRDRRERMFKAYSSRGRNGNANDNRKLVTDIMRLRAEKAALLGYDCPANFILSDKMAGNASTVDNFLETIFRPAVAKAREEIADMQEIMNEDIAAGLVPAGETIRPWDWFHYAERVRQRKYDLDEEMTKPYFKMENVRQGVFETAHKLYGINVEKLDSVKGYHPDVEVFRVSDADGSLIGIFLTDYFPRQTKRGGAWMSNFRNQEITADGQNIRPVIVNVGNFNKPSEDTPSLLTLDQVSTMFHEFGHALHGLLSQCTYEGVSGTSVARDFVELPSQINENWAFCPEVLATYARHYQTGEVIPQELVDKIVAASKFNQGFMTTELAAASILDMKWHELSSVDVPADSPLASEQDGSAEGLKVIDPVKFEEQVCREIGLIDEIIPRYRTTYFAHIFNSGYSAGYYSYLWAEVLDKDAFELFKERGIFNREVSMSFRRNILEKGGSEEPMVLYRRFRGADPDPKALLKARGLE